jgi:hypothetical protein
VISFFVGIFLSCASLCFAQPFVRQIESVPVKNIDGSFIRLPFAGGINAPKHKFADIDGDGDLDLIISDNDNNIDVYRNAGNSQSADFHLCRGCLTLPPFLFWFLFVDLDGDGKLDLCTDDSSSGVRYYRNQGTAQSPDFVLQVGTMPDSAGNPINAGFSSIPAFVDIDGDSLIDFLSSNSLDGSVNFYKNIGTGTSPLFKFITGSYQGITVLGDSCYMSGFHKRTHHGAGALTYVDIDNNGTQDMFYGDLFSHGIFSMPNTGTPTQPHLICNTNRFPDPSLLTVGFNESNFVDIDGDGDLDLFVGVLNNLESHGFWMYRNNGTASAPDFQFVTKDYISMIDVGANASPAYVDIDGNGTIDMFVGSLDGALWYFKNTGTPSSPAFELVDTVFAGIAGNFVYSPVFVDIDGDGDKDLFIGRFDGKIAFFRNTGSSNSPQFTAEPSPVDTINVLQNASPAFVDRDGDGDLDLFIGKANGQLSYYRNDGDSAHFMPVLVTNNFGSIDAGEDAKPVFRDIDGDGLADLIVGNADGKIVLYHNNMNISWVADNSYFAFVEPLREAAPAFADIDADGDADLFVGASKGGVHFYRNDLVTAVGERQSLPSSISLHQNFPNPFNPGTNIQYSLPARQHVVLKIYNLLGKEIATLVNGVQEAGLKTVAWDASGSASGIYFYQLRTDRITETKKMILLQ